MKRIIDLSQEIIDNMPVYPGDEAVKLYQDRSLVNDGYTSFRLEIGMHAGTHIDTPMHLLSRTTYINGLPLDRFTGNGCLLDARC